MTIIMLNAIMLNVPMLSTVMLNIIMLNVVMLIVVMLGVVAPAYLVSMQRTANIRRFCKPLLRRITEDYFISFLS